MKIALIGYGKMGKAIEGVAVRKGHEVVLTIDRHNTADLTTANLRQAEVAIEFTGPDTARKNLTTCAEAGIPVVCGSTGWLAELEEMKALFEKKHTGFLYASNFSVGVNIFFELNRRLAALMASHPEYTVGLKEIHHTEKKDAPSGTAISLAEQVLAAIPALKVWVNRPVERDGELSVLSERTDAVPGTHEVCYSSPVDDIEIVHTAHNRQGFAAGALLAAEFLRAKNGIFTMKEVLGF